MRGSGERAPSLDDEIDRFERFSIGLVRLEPVTLDELTRTVQGFVDRLTAHLQEARGTARHPGRHDRRRLLEEEHARFAVSLEQLRELLGVVQRDDHGGHRQALGQYGRLVTEALRRHRADERTDGNRPRPAGPGNHN